jgi:protein involved in polysaccharide export with SLBB domain
MLLSAFPAMNCPVLAQEAPASQTSSAISPYDNSRLNLTPDTIQQIQEGLPPGVLQQMQKVKLDNRPNTPAASASSPESSRPAAGQDEMDNASVQLLKETVAKPALIEQLFRSNYGSALTGALSQFGYNLFNSGNITPSTLAVPDANYVLGPGDTLQIRIWGANIDAEYTGAISREGHLNIPRVGIVAMAGVKFGQAEKVIRKEAEKYVQGINLSVSLARLRSVEVFVVGEVPNPGLQMVPAFSSVLEGLLSSGGVNKSGSLRTIQLFRGNKLYQTIDLYELLLAGSRASDIPLQDRDVIFVPPIGRTAAIAGAIAKAAIFELKDEKSLADLVALGGGLLPQGFSGRIYLRRFENNHQFSVQDLTDALAGDRLKELPLQGGDLLEVNFLGSLRPQVVKLTGNVWREDVFTSRPDLKLSDILTGPDLLKPEAITDFALLHRYNAETTRYESQKVPLQRIFKKDFDLPLQPYDQIQILSRQEYESDKPIKIEVDGRIWRPEFVKLTGHVWFPDIFSFTPDLKLSDILTGPELLQPGAITEFALLHRYSSANASSTAQKIPLAKIFAHEFDQELQPYDRIEILAKASYGISEPIRISGAVWKPGDYEFSPRLTLRDLVAQAGGTRFGANQERIDISRQSIENEQTRTDHFVSSLGEDFTLQPFDYVFVRAVKDANTFKNVTLSGEVHYPGSYRIQDGEKLSDLIDRAGGFTEYAYFYGAVFTSAQAKIVQQKSIDKLLADLEIRIETGLSDQAQTAENAGDAAILQAQQASLRRLLERLRKIGASGRMSLHLASAGALRGSIYDFSLDDGDTLQVPKRPNFVSVVGSVYTPNSFLFQPDLALGDYLAKAGGPTENAAAKYIYVLKANGEVVARSNDHLLFRTFEKTELMPGDTIVVPEDVEKIPYLRLVRDVSDIIFKIAVTAGIALAL